MQNPHPYLSIVIPVYNEQEVLEELYRRLTTALDKIGKTYEIILTNDGSKDRSSEILRLTRANGTLVMSRFRRHAHGVSHPSPLISLITI